MAKDLILMQFTGRHDKNGNEIYEGDTVQVNFSDGSGVKNPCEVVYERALYGHRELRCKSGRIWQGQLSSHNELSEVIGNIYENPDLLTAVS